MKKDIIFLIILYPFFLFSQSKLQFKIGTEYRITPISKVKGVFFSNLPVSYNEHNQLTGTAFNYTLTYFPKASFGFGLSQSFQYSHLYFEDTVGGTTDKSVNGLITDFKVFIIKEFQINDNKSFFVEFGNSLMNSGTSYVAKEPLNATGTNGETLYSNSQRNFNFFAVNFTIGLKYKKFDIGIGAYFIDGTGANFATEDNIILPYIKLNYIFGKK